MMMVASSPGWPLAENDCKPATEPCKACDTFDTCELAMIFLSTTPAEPVKLDFFATP